jgi:hypothetical protein
LSGQTRVQIPYLLTHHSRKVDQISSIFRE